VITGEVGAGKTVALRAALASLDPSQHTLIYLGNPSVGVRGINHAIVSALGGVPKTHHATLTPQAMDLLAPSGSARTGPGRSNTATGPAHPGPGSAADSGTSA
jgi:type II secretory pathway predicted ATPase ExeA